MKGHWRHKVLQLYLYDQDVGPTTQFLKRVSNYLTKGWKIKSASPSVQHGYVPSIGVILKKYIKQS